MLTHNLHHLDAFDRVLVFRRGELRFDGTPVALRDEVPSGKLADLDLKQIEQQDDRRPTPTHSPISPADSRLSTARRLRRLGQQLLTLLRRELTLIGNVPGRRLAVPLLVVPASFAVALHLAVPPADRSMLGFLAILTCIWTGASLSLMSIVNEREVLDHERLLFLRLWPYVSAKSVVLWLLSALQTLIFMLLLDWLRRGQFDGPLFGISSATLILILVGWAAVGTGLLISALAGRNKPLANFLLPLLMMFQIVFSVQVAGRSEAPLSEAYGEFHSGHANADGLRADRWGRVNPAEATSPLGWIYRAGAHSRQSW